MSYIFDSFELRTRADSFAHLLRTCYAGENVTVHESQEDSDRHDPFPFELVPYIVVADLPEPLPDVLLELEATRYGGRFAGT